MYVIKERKVGGLMTTLNGMIGTCHNIKF